MNRLDAELQTGGVGTRSSVAELSPHPPASSLPLRVPPTMERRFLKAVLSPRARGLSLEININPDRNCNFDCAYCFVNRWEPSAVPILNLEAMGEELANSLQAMNPAAATTPAPTTQTVPLRNVALSGDGEPTLSPQFQEAVEMVAHVRATRSERFFKIVVMTNATGLCLPNVQRGLRYLNGEDEIWAKLDAGTQAYMKKVNRTDIQLEQVLKNILETGKRRPIIIQSLFACVGGEAPSPEEIGAYASRLKELREGGAQIQSVQIYSSSGQSRTSCEHLPLATLARIAWTVREVSGLRAEVF